MLVVERFKKYRDALNGFVEPKINEHVTKRNNSHIHIFKFHGAI